MLAQQIPQRSVNPRSLGVDEVYQPSGSVVVTVGMMGGVVGRCLMLLEVSQPPSMSNSASMPRIGTCMNLSNIQLGVSLRPYARLDTNWEILLSIHFTIVPQ